MVYKTINLKRLKYQRNINKKFEKKKLQGNMNYIIVFQVSQKQ